MFTSENDRLEKINNALLGYIAYLSRTIKDQDDQIEWIKKNRDLMSAGMQSKIDELEGLIAKMAVSAALPTTDDTSNLREMERINRQAIRKVLAQGRIVSPVRTAARRAMAIEERRLEGKA